MLKHGKNSNICASQDLISNQLDMVQQTTGSHVHVFAAPQQPFPHFPQHLSNLIRVSSKLVMPKIK
jgi:hypothetical protein